MADEENPLGGGPFGVGPFGPLIPVAAAAAAAFSMVVVTTASPAPRTLFYQANIAPPPQEPVVVEAETFSITTGGARTRSLFYQASIRPPSRAVEVVVDVTPAQWLVPLSRTAPRPPVKITLTTPFIPKEAVLENTQTPDKWLPRWQGPPSYHPAPAGGSPFVPKEATRENTVTPDAWMPRWQKAVLPSRPIHTQPAFGYPYEAAVVSNLTTTLEWMIAWSGTKRPLLPLAGGVVNVPLPSNLTTTLEWQVGWRGPPRSTPAPQGGQPFVPKEAVLENTVTPDKWLFRWHAAVPVPPVHHTQPVFGYPYEAASNLTTSIEWLRQWQGPPRYWPIKVQALPFVAKADVVDQVTPDKWLIRWQGPPRYLLPLPSGSPFVAKEAVLENTVTPDKWLVRFAKAVPVPKPVPSQPVLGYPYESQAIVVPYEQWWHQPLSRPASRPSVHAKPYQPFVPKEAVAENTQTPDKWLQRWQGPPAYRPIKVQTPPFVPKAAIQDVVTPDKWHRDLGRAAAKRPVTHTQPGWSYAPVAVENTVTIEKWQQALSRAVATPKPRPTQPTYAPYEPPVVAAAADIAASITSGVLYRKTLFYQAKVQPYYPYEGVVTVCIPAFQIEGGFQFDAFQTCGDEQEPPPEAEVFGVTQTTTTALRSRSLFYQAFAQPYGYPYISEVEGGPADEPERVICVLRHSRVAVVPEALRVATVPVDLRVATVPELSRTVEVLFSDRDEESNQFRTLPCAGGPQSDEDAFQDDAFPEDGFQ